MQVQVVVLVAVFYDQPIPVPGALPFHRWMELDDRLYGGHNLWRKNTI